MRIGGHSLCRVGVAVAVASSWALTDLAYAQSLSIDDWLRRPGVKLVAVEFYATWCKPCMDAVPRWKALHDRYQARGLRFVVVSTQDPDGSCSNPGWTPDAVICDDDGFLAQRFGARRLPAAYLWSWQGELLAKQTHVDDVEAKIRAWMRRSPRVEVEVGRIARGASIRRDDLLSAVRDELRGTDKLVVVATEAERKQLRALVRRSLKATADDALACKVGAEVTANSLVKASITGARAKRLRLRLLSAERGCLVASASARWRSGNATASVREAVAALMGRLRRSPTQYPWSGTTVGRRPPPATETTDYQALLKQAEEAERRAREAKAQAKRLRADRQQRLEKAWAAVSKAATTRALNRSTRIGALERFLGDFPDDNPHLKTAGDYLARLKAGREPGAVEGMVEVPGGEFFMGCNADVDRECFDDEKPGRRVQVAAFRIDRTEVTVAAYQECVTAGKCSVEGLTTAFSEGQEWPDWTPYCNWNKTGRKQHPINCVTWEHARAYCAWAGKRLPTEMEWEKAARGTDGRKYPWGNRGYRDRPVANVADESAKRRFSGWTVAEGYDDGYAATAPVGTYSPAGDSPYGAQDMLGNVQEWTSDWFERGESRSQRGGSWYDGPKNARASDRNGNPPTDRGVLVGFRCAQ